MTRRPVCALSSEFKVAKYYRFNTATIETLIVNPGEKGWANHPGEFNRIAWSNR